LKRENDDDDDEEQQQQQQHRKRSRQIVENNFNNNNNNNEKSEREERTGGFTCGLFRTSHVVFYVMSDFCAERSSMREKLNFEFFFEKRTKP